MLTVELGNTAADQVLDGMIGALADHDFIFGRFMDLSHSLGCECYVGYRLPQQELRLDGCLFCGRQGRNQLMPQRQQPQIRHY